MRTCLLIGMGIAMMGILHAQKQIIGTVTDPSGEPLIGANILVTGTTVGTITEIDGSYSLQIPSGATTLEFSFTGYVTQVIPMADQSVIHVILKEGEVLDEVVVIGYGTVKREDVTGSLQAVSAKDFNQGAIASPQNLLQGKVPGVSIISNSGAPGEGATIRVRGLSSLSASNDPLIVIDGVPIDNEGVAGMRNPLNIINPNDIETFTVLKDASATAIYGNRASGGVILITTKKGTVGSKTQFSYNGNIAVSQKRNQVDVLNATEFRELIEEQYDESHPARALLGDANTDWQEEIYQTALSHDHNLSVSGSLSEVLPYRVSVGLTSQEGILMTDKLNRYTGAITLNPQLMDNRLQINANAKLMHLDNRFANRAAIGSAVSYDPTKPARDPESPYGGYHTWLDNTGNINTLAVGNPLALLEQTHDEANVTRFIGNIQADYRFAFLPALRANLNLALDNSDTDGSKNVDADAAYERQDGVPRGKIEEYTQNKNNRLLEFYLNYADDISAQVRMDIMGGYSWQRFYKNGINDAIWTADRNLMIKEATQDEGEYFLLSYFGRANFSFNDRIYLTGTVRHDGTSRFANGRKWGTFPAASAAIKLIDRDDAAFSNFKVRLGWGITGQQALNDDYYPAIADYELSQITAGVQFGDEFVSTNRPNGYNAQLKWEETTTLNAGLDYGIFQDRLTGSLDIYSRKTKDLLNFITVPAGTNLTNELFANVGRMETKGVEFLLHANLLENAYSSWDMGFNIAYNTNEITGLTLVDDPDAVGVLTGDISGGVGSKIQVHTVGYSPNSFYVSQQVYGDDGLPIQGIFVDRDQNGIINSDDNYRLYDPYADVLIGFNSSYRISNFDLSMSARASLGNRIYNNVWSNRGNYQDLYNSTGIISNVHSIATTLNWDRPSYFSDYFVQNASFLRLDHITVGYNFDDLIGAFTRMYVTIQNPIVITSYQGLDPEIQDGIDNDFYPRPLTFLVGLKVQF